MTPNPPQEEIVRRFRERYSVYDIGMISEQLVPNSGNKEPIEDFILSALHDERGRIVRMLEGMKEVAPMLKDEEYIGEHDYLVGKNDALSAAIQAIKKEES